jgi:YHS domain-containing protein
MRKLASFLCCLLGSTASAQVIDFTTQIKPLFETRCNSCHGDQRQKGNLRLDLFADSLHEGEDKILDRGHPERSSLYLRVMLPKGDPDIMPAKGDPLTTEQTELLRKWILDGATWPTAGTVAEPSAEELWLSKFGLESLSEQEQAEGETSRTAVQQWGGIAQRVAAKTLALDVNLSLVGQDLKDAQLTSLSGLRKTAVWLNLARTDITDEGLAHLSDLTRLERINLSQTKITDQGLRSLKAITELRVLNLFGTAVTDAGLDSLSSHPHLERLYLWGTKVTPAAAARFKNAHPRTEVDLGKSAQIYEPPPPVNTTCPIMNKPANATFTSAYRGEIVAFCCGDCLKKFESDPSPYLARLDLVKIKPLNEKCPIDGEEVQSGYTVEWKHAHLGFCSKACLAEFTSRLKTQTEKDPQSK